MGVQVFGGVLKLWKQQWVTKKEGVYLYVEQVLLSFIPSYKSLENSLIMNRRLIASYRVLSSVKIQAG